MSLAPSANETNHVLMIKIYCNHNKQNITYSFTLGQSFPILQGKLLRIEINGNELLKLTEVKEIPLQSTDNTYLIWHDKHASKILNILKDLFL